jgi:outer membrane receptor protein involved in Fe transport
VTVANVDTGIERTATSNDEGYFTVPSLPRGNYRISASKTGFKTTARTGVNLDEGQVLRLDLQLELGEVKEAIEISGAAPLLESATPTMSTVISNQKITQLPLLNRNIITLAALAPTVRPVGAFGGLPVSSFDGARMSIGGGPPSSNNLMIDGVSAENFTSGGLNVFLSVDATEEFRIVTRNPSAEYGRTGGGVVNIVSKSGTNEWHGSAYEFHRNRALNAANFFFNRNRTRDALGNLPKKPQFTLNQWGATLGGPVVKNKTFFFFNYEGFELRETQQAIRTVPTTLQRQGDFRGTLDAQGRQIMIYDPATTRPGATAGTFVRDVVSCNGVQNVICANRISPVAQAVLGFYPQSNQAGNIAGANNFFGLVGVPQSKRIYGIKLDHNFTGTRRLSGRYTYDDTFRGDPNFFGNEAEPNESALPFRRDSIALNYSDALSSSLVVEAKAGLNRYAPNRITRSIGFDMTKLGFNPSVNNLVQLRQFPRLNISDVNVIGASQGDQLIQANNAYTFGVAATQTLTKHTLKYGWEQRIYQLNNSQLAVPVLDFTFNRSFTQGPSPNATGTNLGYGLATFLLGAPTAGAVSRFALSTYTVKNTGLYLQDDYKLTQKLTLNLGLRWEYEGGMTDRFDAIANFDPTLQTQVGATPVRGGLIYPGVNGLSRGHRDASYKEFQPRLGFAYQWLSKTVVRGGYGIYFLPSTGNFVTLGRTGFDQTTSLIATDAAVNGGFSPVANLVNPFPDGAIPAVGNAGGPTTGVGTSISANLRTMGRGYSQQANFNIQHELPKQVLVEIGYAMNRGVGLPANRTYDYLPFSVRQGLTTAELQQAVANPFFGTIRAGGLSAATVQRQNLLDTYPQYLGGGGLDSWASSIYHAMTVKVERRFTRGFSVLAAYTWSKLIDDNLGNGANAFVDGGSDGVQDWDNLRAERSISSNDLPHRFVLSSMYDLPFGKTGPGFYRALVGGWQLNGILTLQSGNPIGVTVGAGGRPFAGSRPNLIGDPKASNRTIDGWFNAAAFELPAERTAGTGPRNLSNYRTDGLATLDLSLNKSFAITERFRLQFRAEAFNFTNTPTFGQPGTGFGSPTFGVITTTATAARQVQLGLKLLF